MLGWDWFGINFDDGSDLLVSRHRDARSGRTVALRLRPEHQRTLDLVISSGFVRSSPPPARRVARPSLWRWRWLARAWP